jgi:hypothetical protein
MQPTDPTDLRDQIRRFLAPAAVLIIAAGAVSIWGPRPTDAPVEIVAARPGPETPREPAASRDAAGVPGAADAEEPISAGASIGIAQR